jgi:hypothetical protein
VNQNDHEAIIIDDDMDDGQESMDPEERFVVVSSENALDNPPVPEDILAVPQELGATKNQDPARLWKEWMKIQETQREQETVLMGDQHSLKATKTKIDEFEHKAKITLEAKARIPEDNEEPVPKRPRFIQTVDRGGGTIRRRQVLEEEEDLVETFCHYLAAKSRAAEWTAA